MVARLYQNRHFMAMADHKVGKHYFHMLPEPNTMVFNAATHLCLSGLNWSRPLSTKAVDQWRSRLRMRSKEVETLFYSLLRQIYSGKYLPNFIRVGRVLQKIWQTFSVFFGSQFQLPFAYKTRMLSFTSWCRDGVQVRWKTVTLLYNMCI